MPEIKNPWLNATEARRALETVALGYDAFEIRIIKGVERSDVSGKFPSTYCGYFDDVDRAVAQLERLQLKIGSYSGAYVLLNEPVPELLARYDNKLVRVKGDGSTSDDHIVERSWLLVDCDPVRVSITSSTDVEKRAARIPWRKSASF